MKGPFKVAVSGVNLSTCKVVSKETFYFSDGVTEQFAFNFAEERSRERVSDPLVHFYVHVQPVA